MHSVIWGESIRTHTEDASKPRKEEQELLQVDGE